MNSFRIEQIVQVEDDIGGYINAWATFKTVQAYIDMLSGNDLSATQNAITEESTHVLIIPKFTKGITDKMRVVDDNSRLYHITYADDPVGQGHHNELYLKYGGELNG